MYPPREVPPRRKSGVRGLDWYSARVWIHLLRHGIAIDRADPRCPPDPKRPLTDKGIARTTAAVKGMRRLGIEPDMILTSPYLRARQTADIVRDILVPEVPMKRVSALVPEGDPAQMLSAIVATGSKAPICVGHAPSLDELAAHVGGSGGPVIKLKKAGLCTLLVETPRAGGGRLYALLPPAMLRALSD